jgi:hypothetical protein
MKTRRLPMVDVSLDIEHRTDGWYYRVTDEAMEYLGPFTLEGLSEQFADCFLVKLGWHYQIFYKEAPR